MPTEQTASAPARSISGITECVEIAGRGNALTIDHGRREVAETALAFVSRFVE